jgi:transcriptional regulator with XRE-family HTH domain
LKTTIGNQIKNLRKKKGLTLKEVSEKTSLSISFLSQVERSKSSTTLESLKKIAEVLGVNPSFFFTDEGEESKSTIKRSTLHETNLTKNHFIYKDLSGELANPLFTPILVTLNPGDTKGSPFSHKGQEFLYILDGTLTILIEDVEYTLKPSDCIHFDSTVRHYWFNRTDSVVKFLCVSAVPHS